MSDYDYDYGSTAEVGGLIGFLLSMGLLLLLIGPIIYVLTAWFMMNIFEKAGVQGKWRAWVPFYNMMVFMKLGDVNPWLIFFSFAGIIPFIGWIGPLFVGVLAIIAAYRIGLKLQKGGAWVILYIFLALVWLGINAFDKSRWNNNVPMASWASNGFIGDKSVWQGIPVQPSGAAAAAANPATAHYAAQTGYPAPGTPAPPQGYAPPAPQGYAPPAPQGYAPPAPGAPVPPAPGAAVPPAPPQSFAPPAAPAPDAATPAPPAPAAPAAPVADAPAAPAPSSADVPAPPAPPAAPSSDEQPQADAPSEDDVPKRDGEQPPA